MLDRETCREHILSEDYRDFIGNHVRTPFFNSLMNVHRCEQEAGFSYKCFYLPKEISDPITLPKYSYKTYSFSFKKQKDLCSGILAKAKVFSPSHFSDDYPSRFHCLLHL